MAPRRRHETRRGLAVPPREVSGATEDVRGDSAGEGDLRTRSGEGTAGALTGEGRRAPPTSSHRARGSGRVRPTRLRGWVRPVGRPAPPFRSEAGSGSGRGPLSSGWTAGGGGTDGEGVADRGRGLDTDADSWAVVAGLSRCPSPVRKGGRDPGGGRRSSGSSHRGPVAPSVFGPQSIAASS